MPMPNADRTAPSSCLLTADSTDWYGLRYALLTAELSRSSLDFVMAIRHGHSSNRQRGTQTPCFGIMTSHHNLRTTASFALLIAAFVPSSFCLAFVSVQQTSRPLSARRRVPAHALSSSSPLSTRSTAALPCSVFGTASCTTASVLLAAKKGAPKGFGKAPAASTAGQKTTGPTSNTSNDAPDTAESSSSAAETDVGGLQSIEGASTTDVRSPPPIDLDPSLSMEERTKQILRQQYGLKPAAETEQDVAKARREMELAGTL